MSTVVSSLNIIKISEEEYQELLNNNFKTPSNFYFKDAIGDYVFIVTRDREKASKWLKDVFDGFYTLRVMSNSKGSGQYTAKGVATRKGQKKYN